MNSSLFFLSCEIRPCSIIFVHCDPNAANTGAYAAARAKIDVKVPAALMQVVAQNAENAAPQDMRICGLKISELDGSTLSLRAKFRQTDIRL